MNNDIILSLGEEYSNSKLNTLVYEQELREINTKYPLDENQVDIKATYFLKNENDLEVGFFIRNGLGKSVSFENVCLVIEDESGKDLVLKEFNLKNDGIIQPCSARPFVVRFPITNEINLQNVEEYTIKFSKVNNLSKFHSVTTELVGLPIDISFEKEKAIRDFILGLKTLREGEFDISEFNLRSIVNGGLECTMLFRNGTNKEAKVEKLPIYVIDDMGEAIAQKIFYNIEGIIKIGPKQAKLMTFQFERSETTSKEFDLSKCKVICK
jgi:SLAP domain-containing protein